MKRKWVGVLAAASIWAGVSAGSSPDSTGTPGPAAVVIPPDSNWVFSLILGSQLYPDWKDSVEVRLGEAFYIGDTEFQGKVTEFMPHFGILDRKPMNLSTAMKNPAVRVFVYGDTGVADSAWAFLNFPPHFSAKSFFRFQLAAIRGYEPGAAAAGAPAQDPSKKEDGQ